MQCITTPTFNVTVNGNLANSFQPEQRIRQGDPILPYIFIICPEYLEDTSISC